MQSIRPPLVVLLAASFALLSLSAPTSANAQRRRGKHKVRVKAPTKRKSKRPVAPELTLQERVKRKGLIAKGSFAKFGSRTVKLASGQDIDLATVAAAVFKEHNVFERNSKASNIGLSSPPRISADIYELPASYLLVRRASVVVSDVRKFGQKSPMYKQFLRSHTGTIRTRDLGNEAKKGLAAFKKGELKRLPSSHPLRKAAAKGDDALLAAISAGLGDFAVEDTIEIPKKAPVVVNGKLMGPKIVNGVLDYRQQIEQTRRSPIGERDLREPLDNPFATTNHATGKSTQKLEFLAGFTASDSWSFSRKYSFTSGFVRFGAGLHYALGLRIPIVVETELSPTWHCSDKALDNKEDTSKYSNIKLKVKTIDGDSNYYRRAGLPNSAIADGHEFALQAGMYYSYKVRVAWTTIAKGGHSEEFNFGKNFVPVMGDWDQLATIDVPPSITNTEVNSGVLSASAALSFKLSAKGKVKFELDPIQKQRGALSHVSIRSVPSGTRKIGNGPANRGPFELTFDRQGSTKNFRLNLSRTVGSDHTEKEFGFLLKAPLYHSKWSITPGIHLKASAGLGGYRIRYDEYVWLDSARVPIGSFPLKRHRGTRRFYRTMEGRKIFHRNQFVRRNGKRVREQYCKEHPPQDG